LNHIIGGESKSERERSTREKRDTEKQRKRKIERERKKTVKERDIGYICICS
jgi:hypothetical protein